MMKRSVFLLFYSLVLLAGCTSEKTHELKSPCVAADPAPSADPADKGQIDHPCVRRKVNNQLG